MGMLQKLNEELKEKDRKTATTIEYSKYDIFQESLGCYACSRELTKFEQSQLGEGFGIFGR